MAVAVATVYEKRSLREFFDTIMKLIDSGQKPRNILTIFVQAINDDPFTIGIADTQTGTIPSNSQSSGQTRIDPDVHQGDTTSDAASGFSQRERALAALTAGGMLALDAIRVGAGHEATDTGKTVVLLLREQVEILVGGVIFHGSGALNEELIYQPGELLSHVQPKYEEYKAAATRAAEHSVAYKQKVRELKPYDAHNQEG
ncbi:hypothetical protein B0I37DRAFT_443611 [Chaetomium sp. MPI-CAGE-AT-0009]|nr:hypothetical protein B0I37DRAFT_443611 [Chaetomium sp. MPI-CAGE-AT-0009]